MLDSDLQQRACEYYALAMRPDEDELLQNICEEMPPFPPRESALLGRLNRKLGDTEDKRTWIHGGKEVNQDRELIRQKTMRKATGVITGSDSSGVYAKPLDGEDVLSDLAGLVLSPSNQSQDVRPETTEVKPPVPPLTHGVSVDRWFEKLCYTNDGVLYEDVQIQMGIKSEYHSHLGRVAVYLGNKITVPLTSFTATVHVQDPDALSVTFAKIPQSTIAPRAQLQQLLHVECKKSFTSPPLLSISFLAGSHQTITVRLPIVITKFFEGVKLGPTDFFDRWKLIGGPPREAQVVFPIGLTESGHIDIVKNKSMLSGHRFGILDDIDPNPSNLVAAGVLHTSSAGKVGCLVRLEPNRDAKASDSFILIDFASESISCSCVV